MLDEKVGGANLALGDTRNGARTGARAVVGSHVVLELLGIGACGGLPSRDLVGGVEVVGEVLGVGVAHFPSGRKTGVSLDEGTPLVGVLGSFAQELKPWMGKRGQWEASACPVALGAYAPW